MKLSTRFLLFDDCLAARDVPPLSAWWRAELTRYLDAFEAGDASELWAAVGRGGSKSTALYKLALFFALHGMFTIPEAERHWAIVISRQRGEAEKGIVLISRWLHALRIEHRAVGSEIELSASNRGIRVVGASVGAASGWRSFFVGCDEFSKWSHDGAAIMLDADEILTSARAMTATHAHTPVVVFSSPWLDSGSFYDAIHAGDVPGRVVAGPAATWVANPEAATEESLRRKERNPTKFRREYACEFSAEFEGGFFPGEAIDACTDRGRAPMPPATSDGVQHFMAIDPAFIADLFAIVVGHVEPGRVVIDYVEALTPPKGAPLSADRAVAHVVGLRRRYPGPRGTSRPLLNFA